MKKFFAVMATGATLAAFAAGAASAAPTVSFTALTTGDLSGLTPVANLVPTSHTGTAADYYDNVIGNQYVGSTMVARSPWQGSTHENTDGVFSSVQAKNEAVFTFATTQHRLSLIWGSPDTYNDIVFELSGGGGTETINGSEVFGTAGTLASMVNVKGVGFNTLTIKSGRNAFEFANLTVSTVPLPATGLMLLGGLGALGVAKRRKQKAATA